MDLEMVTYLKNHGGQLLEVSNQQLRLSDTEDLFFIISGKINFYYSHGEDLDAPGRLNELFVMEANQFFFGMGERHPRISMHAITLNGARYIRFPATKIAQLIRDLRESQLFQRALESWFRTLYTFTNGYSWPAQHVRLPMGAKSWIRDGVAAWPTNEFAWFRVLEGEASFIDLYRFSLIGEGLTFPVGHTQWLEAKEAAYLEVVDFANFLAGSGVLESIDHIHLVFYEYLEVLYLHELDVAQKQLLARNNCDQSEFKNALLWLASPLKGRPKGRTSTSGQAIYDAATVVCKAMDLRIIKLPEIYYFTELDMVQAFCRASQFRARSVMLRGRWWEQNSRPLLGFLKADNQPIALLPASATSYKFVHPKTGKQEQITAKNHHLIRERCYQFYHPLPSGKVGGKELLAHVAPVLKKEWRMIAIPSLGAALLAMAFPWATALIFNSAIPAAEITNLNLICFGLLLSSLGGIMFEFARGITLVRMEGGLDDRLQSALWSRLLSLPVSFFKKYSSGDLAQRAMGITTIRVIVSQAALGSIISALFSLILLVQLFLFNTQLGWVALGLAIVGVLPFPLSLLVLQQERIAQTVKGKVSGFVYQVLKGIAKLRVAGAEARVFSLWAGEYSQGQTANYRGRTYGNIIRAWNSAYPLISTMVLFAYAIHLRNDLSLATGTFLAVSVAYGQLIAGVLGATKYMLMSLSAVPLLERIKPILEAEPETGPEKLDPGILSGNIEIRKLSFSYPDHGQNVLDQISFSILPGEFVAVVGPSGSGKSTLLRVLLGFEKPDQGSVFYDGKDLRELNHPALRRQLGVVMQDSRLMAGTIFEQITGSLPLTMDQAWEAAKLASLDGDVREMPMGMFTILGEGGSGMSGGQLQRLLIARALVTRQRILMMDEATSALDNETQARISKNLDAMQVTRLVIAHRLSTIINADKIIVLEKGRIVETGNYQELMTANGLFSRLVNRQLNLEKKPT